MNIRMHIFLEKTVNHSVNSLHLTCVTVYAIQNDK